MNKNRIYLFLLIALFLSACNGNAQQKKSVEPVTFHQEIANKDVQVLDVRTPEEFRSGHLSGAFHADWNDRDEFINRTRHLDPNKPIYTYCLSGVRSSNAAEWLRKNGFQNVINMEGGLMAWKKARLPLDSPVQKVQMTLEGYKASIPVEKTVLVDFGAKWCIPCVKMNPVIDSLQKDQNLNFVLLKIDAGEQELLTEQLSIESLPTFIIYKNGKETWRKEGIVDYVELASNL